MRADARQLIESALLMYKGNRTHAAEYLGLQRTYLCRLIREHGIDVPANHERVTYMPPKARA